MTDRQRVALVLGGTYGIGAAITLRMAGDGYNVRALGIDSDQQAELHSEIERRGLSERVVTALGDVSVAADVLQAAESAISRFGTIDVLINVAAFAVTGTLLDTEERLWDRSFEVNVKGPFLAARAVLPHMIRQGHGCIINFGSGAGFGQAGPRPGFAYSVSKGAIFGFTRSLALECARSGVRVLTVVPGGTYPVAGNSYLAEDVAEEIGRTMTVAGRWNRPDEIASAVAWLASDEASTISGGTFEIGTLPRWAAGMPPDGGSRLAREAAGRPVLSPASYMHSPTHKQ